MVNRKKCVTVVFVTNASKNPDSWNWATVCEENPLVCTTVAAYSGAVGPQYGRGLSSAALTKAAKRVVYEGHAASMVADAEGVEKAILWRNTGAARDIIYKRLKSGDPTEAATLVQAIGRLAGEQPDETVDVAEIEITALAELETARHADDLTALRFLSNLAVGKLEPLNS